MVGCQAEGATVRHPLAVAAILTANWTVVSLGSGCRSHHASVARDAAATGGETGGADADTGGSGHDGGSLEAPEHDSGGSEGPGYHSPDDAALATPPLCGPFEACGGVVVGTWVTSWPPECVSPGKPVVNCAGYSETDEVHQTATITFSSDGTYRSQIVMNGTAGYSYPATCEGDAGCPSPGPVSDLGFSFTCGENPPGECYCSYGYDNYAVNIAGTYTTSGGTLTSGSGSSSGTQEYCVRGNTLRVRSTSAFSGQTTTILATKQ